MKGFLFFIWLTLTIVFVQQNMIKAWDGKLPTLYGGEGVLLDASKYIK